LFLLLHSAITFVRKKLGWYKGEATTLTPTVSQ